MGTKPIVSVVTVVKDHEHGLLDTYQSLQSQVCGDWENIIIVGKSQDNTLRNARALAAKDKRVCVVEETVQGIYPAMNLEIEHSVGEYLWFMNAGDKFSDSSVLGTELEIIEKSEIITILGGHKVQGDPRKTLGFLKPVEKVSELIALTACNRPLLLATSDYSRIT